MLTIYWDPQAQPSEDHADFVWFDVNQVDDALAGRLLAAASRVSGTLVPCWDGNPHLPFSLGERVLLASPEQEFFAEGECGQYDQSARSPDGPRPGAIGWVFKPDWSSLRYA